MPALTEETGDKTDRIGRTWFISDTHFGHERIIKLSHRPFASIEEMDETLVRNWNKCVKPEDTVYHLGDVAFGPENSMRQLLSSLSGKRKILIYGNHEKNLALLAECGFKEQHPDLVVQVHGTPVYLIHEQPPLDAIPSPCGHCLHGHNHKKQSRHPFLNIAADLWKFGPLSEDEIADFLDIR